MTRLTCMTLPARINPFYSTIPTQQTKQKCVYGGEGGFLQSANRALKLVQPVLIFLLAFLGRKCRLVVLSNNVVILMVSKDINETINQVHILLEDPTNYIIRVPPRDFISVTVNVLDKQVHVLGIGRGSRGECDKLAGSKVHKEPLTLLGRWSNGLVDIIDRVVYKVESLVVVHYCLGFLKKFILG